MSLRRLALAGVLALVSAGSAFAQAGPESVGLPRETKALATHCSGAVFAELFLVSEQGFKSTYDRAKLDESATIWAISAAKHYGITPNQLADNEEYFGIALTKLEDTDTRRVQVGWCLAHPPTS